STAPSPTSTHHTQCCGPVTRAWSPTCRPVPDRRSRCPGPVGSWWPRSAPPRRSGAERWRRGPAETFPGRHPVRPGAGTTGPGADGSALGASLLGHVGAPDPQLPLVSDAQFGSVLVLDRDPQRSAVEAGLLARVEPV